jgi:plasmid stability protein
LEAFCIQNETMATLTIKNLPDQTYERLRQTAKNFRRSINSEVIFRLERSLNEDDHDRHQLLEDIRISREQMKKKGIWLTNDLIQRAKNEGRP